MFPAMSWKPEADEIERRRELAQQQSGADAVAKQHARFGDVVAFLALGTFLEVAFLAFRNVPKATEGARQPAGRVGRPRELGWAATFLCSSCASFVTGCTFVVGGANWQRRAMLQPEFTPVREQLGKGPFKP
jgi:NAD(P)-dependent dehydrogenase (short-subunit alcohol dehydrogenase family)